jgi:hypothetical protein
MDEPRKATDIVLDLEKKVDKLLDIVNSLELSIKLMSNKITGLSVKPNLPSPPKFAIEAVNVTTKMSDPEFKVQMQQNPNGFRRTSRPETFSGDDNYLAAPPPEVHPKFPAQIPNQIPNQVTKAEESPPQTKKPKETSKVKKVAGENNIPIMQRVTDKNGKSVFLADVEVFNDNKESIFKTRTNGIGKWMASLPLGNYQVLVKKRESITKVSMEVSQNIMVDGTVSPLDLPVLIIK